MTKWYKKGQELLEEIRQSEYADDQIAFWFIGQCGFVIKWKNKIIYIDPVLNDITDKQGESVRLFEAPFIPDKAIFDYVFCTHKHVDHMSRATLEPMMRSNPDSRLIVPGACISIIENWNILPNLIIPSAEHERLQLGEIVVFPISTAHPTHKRDEMGRNMNLAYAISFGETTVLHLGDTYITDELLDNLKMIPNIDILMAPINGRSYFREKNGIIGNVSAEEAAELAVELNVDLTIPMHYDMIKGNTCDPKRFINEYNLLTDNKGKWKLPGLGERVIYRKG